MGRWMSRNIFEILLATSCVVTAVIVAYICLLEPSKYIINKDSYCEVELYTQSLRGVTEQIGRDEDGNPSVTKIYKMNCYYEYEDMKFGSTAEYYDELPRVGSVTVATMNKTTHGLVCVKFYNNIMYVCMLFLFIAAVIWFSLIV